MIGAALASLLMAAAPVPAAPAPWSYYCWVPNSIPHPPTFKIAIQGVRGNGHGWLMTWKDWQARAEPTRIVGDIDVESITWLGKDKGRKSGRIYFSGPFADGMPRMLTIRIGESLLESEVFDCIPAVVATYFSPEERPDF